MAIQLISSNIFVRRAEELFRAGNTASGCMQILLAARLLGLSTSSINASALPDSLQAYAPALPRYIAMIDEIRFRARRAQTAAYAPYSLYSVGAALLADDGTIHDGCNVEVSSYGLTICAERSALVAAVAQRKRHFAAIAVVTDSSPPASPCGACRQMMYEFAPDLLVIMLNPKGEERWVSLRTLLPDAFISQSLSGHNTGRDTTHYRANDIP